MKVINQFATLQTMGSKVIALGYAGENERTRVIINCAEVLWEYPNAVASMIVSPPGGVIYPKTVTMDGTNVIWDVTDEDLGRAGSGTFQLTFTEDGQIVKSAIGNFRVDSSLDPTGSAPEPVINWLENAVSTISHDMFVVDCGTIDTLPVTLDADGVTAAYKPVLIELGTPTAINGNITVTTGAGVITLGGELNSGASTTVTLTMVRATAITATAQTEVSEE